MGLKNTEHKCWCSTFQGLSRQEYEAKKERVADALVHRLEPHLPGLQAATLYREVTCGSTIMLQASKHMCERYAGQGHFRRNKIKQGGGLGFSALLTRISHKL